MSKIYAIIFIIIIVLLLYEFMKKYTAQQNMYKMAQKLSKMKNKKLLVIGNPHEGALSGIFPGYSCGDICIDLNGCYGCSANTLNIRDKLENVLHKIETNSVVIFESETLEYVDDAHISYIIDQLYRISGGDIYSVHTQTSNKFIAYIKNVWYYLFNVLTNKKHFFHKRIFTEHPPHSNYKWITNP